MNYSIFITGITGFLGSFLAKEFLDAGYHVYGLARSGKGKTAQERVIAAVAFVYGAESVIPAASPQVGSRELTQAGIQDSDKRIVDSRLRGNDKKRSVIPAQAGIQDISGSPLTACGDDKRGRFAKYQDALSRLHVVEGDIVHAGLGMTDDARAQLAGQIDSIIHSAALAELKSPLDHIWPINVGGTAHVLDFARECRATGRLQRFNHISTMYVAGTLSGTFDETMYAQGQAFHNTYEQTKFEAEGIVRAAANEGLPVAIFRPSMIMGDSMTGKTANFRLMYQPLHFFANELFDVFPGDLSCGQNLIHMDTVAHAIALLIGQEANQEAKSQRGKVSNKGPMSQSVNESMTPASLTRDSLTPGVAPLTLDSLTLDSLTLDSLTLDSLTLSSIPVYHIMSPQSVNQKIFWEFAADYFGFRLPTFVRTEDFEYSRLTVVQRELAKPFVPYLNYRTVFDNERTCAALHRVGFALPGITTRGLAQAFSYCHKKGFIKKKGLRKWMFWS